MFTIQHDRFPGDASYNSGQVIAGVLKPNKAVRQHANLPTPNSRDHFVQWNPDGGHFTYYLHVRNPVGDLLDMTRRSTSFSAPLGR
jgi:hypothetical protein